MSETTENSIEVSVSAHYVEGQSEPSRNRYVFSYTITITNFGNRTAQLISRHWIITDADGNQQEVHGDGVVGEQPSMEPGEGFRYTDAGYLVLGRLIEAATGHSYYDLLQERILNPQGLSEVRPADKSILTNITPGYMGGGSNLKKDGRMKFDPSSEWTGGGLITNPTMLVRFHGALAEGAIVTPESFALMVNSGWHAPSTPGSHYGFGLFVNDDGNSFGHGGLWPGYRTHVTHFAEPGITVAVQTNRDGRLDLEALVRRIAAMSP